MISSEETGCNTYRILNKYRDKGGYRAPEVNTLVVTTNGKTQTIVCDYDLWFTKRVGAEIDLCFHESYLGFDFLEIDVD